MSPTHALPPPRRRAHLVVVVMILVAVVAVVAGCGKAGPLKGAIDDVARALGVGAPALEARAVRLIATGRVTEEALAAALPMAQREASQWDRLAAEVTARVRLKAEGVLSEQTVRTVVQGAACDAFMKAFDGEPIDFAALLRNNTVLKLLTPTQVDAIVGYAGLVNDTFDRLEKGVHPQLALHAARATIECGRAGRA